MENIKFSKIYKVFSTLDNSICYVGSTTQKYLSTRMGLHRNHYKAWKQNKVTKSMIFNIFDEYGVDTCKIELLENVENNNKENLLYRERHYMETLNCVNKNRPIISETERKENVNNYNINNKEKFREYQKVNREKYNEYQKVYQKNYREIIKKLKKNSLEIRNLFKELNSNI